MWSGPLPPPTLLAEYNDAVPDGAERIVSMVERQTAHRMEMEARTAKYDHRLAHTGQWIGLTVVLSQFWYLQGIWFTWEPLQRPLLLSGLTSLALPRYLSMVASAIGSYVRFTWMMLT